MREFIFRTTWVIWNSFKTSFVYPALFISLWHSFTRFSAIGFRLWLNVEPSSILMLNFFSHEFGSFDNELSRWNCGALSVLMTVPYSGIMSAINTTMALSMSSAVSCSKILAIVNWVNFSLINRIFCVFLTMMSQAKWDPKPVISPVVSGNNSFGNCFSAKQTWQLSTASSIILLCPTA